MGGLLFCTSSYKALDQVLLFCTSSYKVYRENLQTVFAREAIRLNTVQVASDKTMNETLNVKKWTDVQLHVTLIRVKLEEGIFMTYSLFNNLVSCTSVLEGLKQSNPRLSVSHHGDQRLCLCRKLRLPYCVVYECCEKGERSLLTLSLSPLPLSPHMCYGS